jgi:hypothetical protein
MATGFRTVMRLPSRREAGINPKTSPTCALPFYLINFPLLLTSIAYADSAIWFRLSYRAVSPVEVRLLKVRTQQGCGSFLIVCSLHNSLSLNLFQCFKYRPFIAISWAWGTGRKSGQSTLIAGNFQSHGICTNSSKSSLNIYRKWNMSTCGLMFSVLTRGMSRKKRVSLSLCQTYAAAKHVFSWLGPHDITNHTAMAMAYLNQPCYIAPHSASQTRQFVFQGLQVLLGGPIGGGSGSFERFFSHGTYG